MEKSIIKDESGAEIVLPRITHTQPIDNWWILKKDNSLNYFERAIVLVVFDYFEPEMEVIEQSTALLSVSDLGLASVVEMLSEERHYLYSETYPGG